MERKELEIGQEVHIGVRPSSDTRYNPVRVISFNDKMAALLNMDGLVVIFPINLLFATSEEAQVEHDRRSGLL